MAIFANFHSMIGNAKVIIATHTSTSLETTIELCHRRYILPSKSGMKIDKTVVVLKPIPAKSMSLILPFGSSVTTLVGKIKDMIMADITAQEASIENKPLQVDFPMKAAAKNGADDITKFDTTSQDILIPPSVFDRHNISHI